MDYLGWELERQRAALRALLGGGGEGEASGEEPSGRGGKAPGDGTRRSLASLEGARRRGSGRTGRYAGGRGEAGGPLAGAPGAWEMVREAERAALVRESGGPARTISAEGSGEEENPPARGRRDAETGAPPFPRRYAERGAPPFPRRYATEELRRTPRIGTGGTAELPRPSGGQGDETERETAAKTAAVRETAARTAAERETAARTAARTAAEAATGAAGGRRAGEDPAGRAPAMEAGGVPSPGERPGGGEAAASAAMSRAGAGPVRLDRDGGTAGRGERLVRSLPWGEGWESPALRAEDGAKALSRAVQRDARRYDGGFTIY